MQFGESITAQCRAQARLERRFYHIAEAAERNGMPPATAYCRIAAGKLRVVEIPSPEPNPTRRIIRVPASWASSWIEAWDVRVEPETEWPAIDGEPLYLSVAQVAETLAISTFTVYGLIRTGPLKGVVAKTPEGFETRLSRVRLDRWCRDLVLRAQSDWCGVEPVALAVAR